MDKSKIIKPCLVCDEGDQHYRKQDVEIARRGLVTRVPNVAGWFCNHCDEIDFDEDTDSRLRYVEAGEELVTRAREEIAKSLKQARKTLNLSQSQAALIAGGGHNAFSRYETGTAQPVMGIVHLFTLLSRHPELLKEVNEMTKLATSAISLIAPTSQNQKADKKANTKQTLAAN